MATAAAHFGRGGAAGPAPTREPLVALPKSAFERLLDLACTDAAEVAAQTRPLQLVSGGPPGRDEQIEALLLARGMYQLRRRRDLEFGAGLFAEPAWDMLLDLYVAERTGRRVSVSSACIASAAPSTTALRWIANLEEKGMMRRENDPRDGRRVYVRMPDETLTKMEALLKEARGVLGRGP